MTINVSNEQRPDEGPEVLAAPPLPIDFNSVDLLREFSSQSTQIKTDERSILASFGEFKIVPTFVVEQLNEVTNEEMLQKLLSSEKPDEAGAAKSLLALNKNDPTLFHKAMDLWKNGDAETVNKILQGFDDASHLSGLFDLCADKTKRAALDALLSKNQYLPAALLDLLNSPKENERTTGSKLLNLLNGNDKDPADNGRAAQNRTDAFRMLHFVSDPDRLATLVGLLESPATADGTREVLRLRDESYRARDVSTTSRMLDFISAEKERGIGKTREVDRSQLTTFLGLVSGNGVEKELAQTIVRFDDKRVQSEVLSRLSSPDTRHSGINLCSMGETAIDMLLDVRDSDKAMFEKSIAQIEKLSPEKLKELSKALETIRSTEGVSRFLQVYNDPERKAFSDLLISNLVGGSPAEFVSARRLLLTPSGTPDPFSTQDTKDLPRIGHDPVSVRTLEDMYADPKRSDIAKFILQQRDVKEQTRLTQTFGNPENAKLTQNVGDLLKRDPELAKELTLHLKTPKQMNKFLDIYSNQPTAATELRRQLSSGVTEGLMSMLTAPDNRTLKLGEDLLKSLNVTADGRPLNPDRDGWLLDDKIPQERKNARMLIQSGLAPAAIDVLKDALADDKKQSDAISLLQLAAQLPWESKGQLSEKVHDLYSKDKKGEAQARILLDSFARQPETTVQLLRHTTGQEPSLNDVLDLATTPDQIKAVVELFQLRDSDRRVPGEDEPPPPQPKVSAAAVLRMMGERATASSAKAVVDMLANPESHNKAIALLEVASRGEQEGTVRLLDIMFAPNATQKALSEVTNGLLREIDKPGNVQALENLAHLLDRSYLKDTLDTTIKLLQDPAKRESAIAALRALTKPEPAGGMLKLLASDRKPVVEAMQEMLKNPSGADLPRIENALTEILIGKVNGDWIASMLEDPKTRETAKSIILLSADSNALDRVRRYLKDEARAPKVKELLALAEKDSNLRNDVGFAISRVERHFDLSHTLLTSGKDRDLGTSLNLLYFGDTEDISFGNSVMGMLIADRPISNEFARSLIGSYHDTSAETRINRRVLSSLVNRSSEESKQLFDRMTGADKQPTREFFDSLYTSERKFGQGEELLRQLTTLQSSDPKKAEQIWAMINDSRNHKNAKKMLEMALATNG